MKLNILFAVVCFGILGYVIISRGGVAPTPAVFEGAPTDLQSAVQRASDEGKVVVAVATADWCAPCQVYKRNALVDDRVVTWLDAHAVTITIDMTDQSNPPSDGQALGVAGYPTTFLISADGELLASAVGALSADKLGEWLTTNAGR